MLGWIKDINETQKCVVDFPIIADPERKISALYDVKFFDSLCIFYLLVFLAIYMIYVYYIFNKHELMNDEFEIL